MQLILQYLAYSQQVLARKVQATRAYIVEQSRQLQNCKTVHKKQKLKMKQYQDMIESLNEQALHYEVLAKRVCPSLLDQKGHIQELLAGDAEALHKAADGDTLYQALEDHQRRMATAKRAMARRPAEEDKAPPQRPREEEKTIPVQSVGRADEPLAESGSTYKLTAYDDTSKRPLDPAHASGENVALPSPQTAQMQNVDSKTSLQLSNNPAENSESSKPPEEPQKRPPEAQVAKKTLSISGAGELNLEPAAVQAAVPPPPAITVPAPETKPPVTKEEAEGSNPDDEISGLSFSQTGSQFAFPSSAGSRGSYVLSGSQNPENVISKRAVLENQTRLTNFRPAVPEEKGEDEKEVDEEIKDEKD